MEIRPVADRDQQQARRLGIEAFGEPPDASPPPDAPTTPMPGRRTWGAFDDDRLAAKVTGLDMGSWFGGASVPTCGVAGVTVAAEDRGRGLLQPLFVALAQEAVSLGQCISTMFPTAPGIYRSLGYELVSSFDIVEVPTAQLAGAPSTSSKTTTRRAGLDDVAAIRAVYDLWASAQSGPLTRIGPPTAKSDQELLDDVTAITLATRVGDGGEEQVTGYVSWRRGDSYRPDAVLTIDELIAADADALRALWGVIGSFASVTGAVQLTTSGDDLARHVLRTATWDVIQRHPYSLRVLDLPAAVAARPDTAPLAPTSVDLSVTGDRLGLLEGSYRLTVEDGRSSCHRTSAGHLDLDESSVSFTTGGIGLLWAGAQSCANLRLMGHLTGPTGSDAVLDAMFGGRQLHIRDYF